MIKAEAVDKTTVINILSYSFKDNQSVNYVVRNDKNSLERIKALMDYSFEMCSMFGEVWMTDDKKGCALILYPQNKKITARSLWLNIRLIFQAISILGISKTLKREAKIQQIQPNEKMAYLWFIGVDPTFQKKGVGSKLLMQIISRFSEMNLPLYLETSTQKNIPWYQSFGFEIYNQITLGYSLSFLKRRPGH
jgi:ribosomal protein S18 acetylase RimI-like enzyme